MAQGTVKFFNHAKGFGFIAEQGGGDIFVHISALHDSGLEGLDEGDEVTFEPARDRKTGKDTAVSLRIVGRAEPNSRAGARRAPSPRDGGGRPSANLGAGTGVVKWFNPAKGFGFIQPDDGGADVFVHISAVERAGLRGLDDGQPIAFDVEQDRRSGKASAVNLRVS